MEKKVEVVRNAHNINDLKDKLKIINKDVEN